MNIQPPTEKQARLIWLAITGLAIAAIVALVVALVWGLGQVLNVFSSVIWPRGVAGVLACLLDPVVGFLTRRKMPRARAILVVFVLAMLIVLGLFASVVPQVLGDVKKLSEKSSDYATQLSSKASELAERPPKWLPRPAVNLLTEFSKNANVTNSIPTVRQAEPTPSVDSDAQETLFKSVANEVTKFFPKIGGWLQQVMGFVGTVFGIIAGLALVPIYAFYFLLEKHGINQQWRDYLPVQDSKFKDEAVFVINSINEYLVAFFRGQVLVAICDGVLYTIGFLIIGLDYALILGVMATCLTIIPFLGAITTCVSALVIAIATTGGWQQPAFVLLVFAVVQMLEGLVIQPKIMGERVGLHPMTIIIALMVGTTLLGGILGGILAIPLAAVLRVLMARYVWRKPAGV